jgi:hypothetical protein
MSESLTPEQIYELIRQAILDRNIIAVSYQDSIREVCPHVLGRKNGHPQVLLYQFAGESASGLQPDGSPENWRCLRLDELSHVALKKTGTEWHTASNYSAMQNCVDEIDVKVEVKAA